MKHRIYIFLITVISIINISATRCLGQQDQYATKYATIIISGTLNDSGIVARSKRVSVVVDYDYSTFFLFLEKSSLKTGIDSLDKKLEAMQNDFIQFEGNFDLDLTEPNRLPEDPFGISGRLSCEINCKIIEGRGRISKIGDVYKHTLNMSFDMNLKEIDYQVNVPGLENEIHVEIFQTAMTSR